MVMTTLAILERARARISSEAHWTRCSLARNAYGISVTVASPEATSWCGVGAVLEELDDKYYGLAKVMKELRQEEDIPFTEFNDGATHREVIGAFDNAIRRLRNEN
jgi:hypothetical protein